MRSSRATQLAVACALAASALFDAGRAAAQTNGDIAFVTGGGTELFEIWSMNEDGTGRKRLITGPPGSIEVDPAVDPATGGQIAFARKAADDETYDLMVKPVVGAATKLTDENGTVANDRQPAWSPIAPRIAFTRMVRAEDTSNVWAINADGTGLVRLTETQAPGYDASPTWSPDGLEIAFVSDRAGGISQIFTMDNGGVSEVQRTFEACFTGNPAWKPDLAEDVIVYERFCPGTATGWDIVELNLTTSSSQLLTSGPDHDHQPTWAPDGSAIVFTRYPAGGGNKEIVKLELTPTPAETALTTDPALDMSPEWTENMSLASGVSGGATGAFRTVDNGHLEATASHGARKPKKKTSRRVARGIRFLQMRRARSDVYVLKVNPGLSPRIDVALSNDLLPGREKTSSMARRHRAIAAINGDFGTRPAHTFAEDGDLKQISFAAAPTFAMTQDEQTTYFGRPFEVVTAKESDRWQVERWNFGVPGFTEISAFTPAAGTLELPPANACSVRLQGVSGRRWAPGLVGVEADLQVTEASCSAMAFGAPAPGQVVLSARPGSEAAILLNSLSFGETVSLTWSIGFAGVLDTVGGIPLLVENGLEAVPEPCTTSLCKKHPRTGIGVTPAGRVLMVVVDGRREDSKGVTLVQFARIMQGLHASFALNLDGGGSSTMVIRGKKGGLQVMNEPSDGQQRKVSSAVLVIKGADPGEAVGAPLARAPAASAPPPSGRQAGELAAMDPASTGGLAEALTEGTFGPPVDLSRELRRALRLFRSSR